MLLVGSIHARPCIGDDPQQTQLLYDFYTATGGPHWSYRQTGSLNGVPWDFETINNPFGYCGWFGINCYSMLDSPGCDQVVQFGFGSANLVGMIPESMAKFISMISFGITDNPGLTGTLPTNLFDQMLNLTNVYLNGNNLVGPVPTFGKPSELLYLQLVNSWFTSINLTGCTALQQIAISNSTIQTILADTPLSQLTSFTAMATNLNDDILPLSWFCRQEKLQWIGLSFNQYMGTVPACLGLLPDLNQLYLSHNALTHVEASKYPQLITVDLSYNALQDRFETYNFPRLVTGIFSYNNLTGWIGYGNSQYIVNIYLDNNPLLNNDYDGMPSCADYPTSWSLNMLDIRNTSITDAWECDQGFVINMNSYIRSGKMYCPTILNNLTFPLPWTILVSHPYFTQTAPCV